MQYSKKETQHCKGRNKAMNQGCGCKNETVKLSN